MKREILFRGKRVDNGEGEYIEREDALDRIDGIWDCADMVFEPEDHCCGEDDCAHCKWRETKNAIRKIIANIPDADVRPVVRWQWKGEGLNDYRCSLCDHVTFGKPNFCPNCGADMREVDDLVEAQDVCAGDSCPINFKEDCK